MSEKKIGEVFGQNTVWLDVKWDIETKIISGEYIAGSKIPTIVELIEKYNIGKSTAQKIITALYNEGIIVKKVGIGCFVKPFIRQKLLEQHEKILQEQATNIIKEALILGLNKEYVDKVIEEKWNEIVNPKKKPFA